MKVLIVDDEEDVRASIRLLIPWDKSGVNTILEAHDGNNAIELIKSERPEIIFTDIIMPSKNGMELLSWIQEYHQHSKTIVISGHDDFQYVQHTLKSGGLDYILKPIDRNEIIKSFENAITNWKKDEAKRSNDIQRGLVISQTKPVFLDKMFSNLLLQSQPNQEAFHELDKEFNLTKYNKFQLAIIRTDMLQETVIQKFTNQIDSLDSIILNICNEIIYHEGYAFKHLNKENEILIITWENFSHFQQNLQKMNKAFVEILHTPFHFGISTIHQLPEDLQTGYREAKIALRQSNYVCGTQLIHSFKDIDSDKRNDLFFSDYSEAIVIAIKSNDNEKIEKAIGKFIQAIKKLDFITLDQFEYWRHEFLLMKSYLFKEIFFEEKSEAVDQQLYFPLNKEGRLSIDLLEKELVQNCKLFARDLAEELRKNHNIIFDIKRYIDNHFDEHLLLQSIADQFFVSREYISRKFKQEFGLNASNYIENIRIENAKVLLMNSELNISDVAYAVGYQDGRYFSKVFKKAVGVTPMKYKRRLK
ncbi:response regulator [Bacillus sp. FJAT-50079]|uniref:response regulator n=1 Tax=Bacillus sp. FJAT-50079 TaxID=2833577 RepID=UPI001BCA13D4|nr:response regulator [Bacillus sp. FJAT-50079]MBS4206581.1 response regulator [Bacillus sp. FJAT-50079]